MSDLAAALFIAIRVHASQRDKQGEPYLLHVLRVVEAVSDEAKVVAALHDVIEDGDIELTQIAASPALGLRLEELHALNLLTRLPCLGYLHYIGEIAANDVTCPIAREVKLADLRDNLGRIPTRESAVEHVGSAEEIALDLGEEWDDQWASLKARYEKALATLEAV